MSSQAAKPSTPSANDTSSAEAFFICGSVLGFLVGLVVLRFLLVICLDCVVLDARDRAWREIAELWRLICPWWHRRTQPAIDVPPVSPTMSARNDSTDLELPMDGNRKERLLKVLPLTKFYSNGILGTTEKLYSQQHPPPPIPAVDAPSSPSPSSLQQSASLQDCSMDDSASQSNESHAPIMCSICLHELHEGDFVFQAKQCHHLFHLMCIAEWMSVTGNDCPNCRTEILPQSVLYRILRGRQLAPEEMTAYFCDPDCEA